MRGQQRRILIVLRHRQIVGELSIHESVEDKLIIQSSLLTLDVCAGAKAEAEATKAKMHAAVNFMVDVGCTRRVVIALTAADDDGEGRTTFRSFRCTTHVPEKIFSGLLKKSQLEVVSSFDCADVESFVVYS